MSSRVRRYTITMAFRTACFVGMIFVQGWPRWVLLALAIFLPYIAVVAANQSDQRRLGEARVERGAPEEAPQLGLGEHVEIIRGHVVADEAAPSEGEREGRVA
jgi:hypothetical protein